MKIKTIFNILIPITGLAFSAASYAAQPAYSSRPTSTNVIYLDYDGENVTADNWSSAYNVVGIGMTDAEILSHWEEVSEAFVGYDVNITTDRAVFDAAQVTNRQMCVLTTNDAASPGNGGVASYNSFGADTVCWAFNTDYYTVVHELGHTFGLPHHGVGSPYGHTAYDEEYYDGNGDWSPFMGAGDGGLQQWSKGEYFHNNSIHDNLQSIANDLGYITDDAPDVLSLATPGQVSSIPVSGDPNIGLTANSSGIISSDGDIDVYRLDISGGTYDIDVSVTPTKSVSLDIKATLYDARWQKIDTANPTGVRSASLVASANTEALYLVISGGNEGTPLINGNGWTSYGSLGSYDFSVNAIRTSTTTPPAASLGYAPLVEDAHFLITSSAVVGSTVGQVIANDVDSGSTLSYAIVSGNGSGGFAIDSNTGEITVASSLDFFTETSVTMTVAVTDNTGFSNDLEATVELEYYTAHDESVDGELSANGLSPTQVTLNSGPNVIIGQASDVDEDFFTFNVPSGSRINKIIVLSHVSARGRPVFMVHRKNAVIPASYDLSDGFDYVNHSSFFEDVTSSFSSLEAGNHSFGFWSDYGDIHDYELLIIVGPAVVVPSLPAEWTNQDVGTVSVVGSATLNSSSEYEIQASGADIWGAADEFHFVHQPLDGDGEITAQVQSLTNTNDWAKAGVMIRETLDANSKNVATLVTPAKGVLSQRRLSTGGNTNLTRGIVTAAAPYWVRLTRVGDVFTSSESADGVTWTVIRSWPAPMTSQVYVGLVLTSHNGGVLATAVYSDVEVTSNSSPVANDASFTIADDSAVGISVGSITATDPDAGDTLSYAITSGNDGGAFAIDANNGEITVAGALDFATQSSYSLLVTVTDSGGLSDTATASVTLTEPNVSTWYSQDIGAVSASGTAVINSNGEDVITASGADIYGTADEFHYSYTSVTGDCEITAQVTSLTNTNAWAKAGVMIRETLNGDSANVTTLVTAAKGVTSQARLVAGGATSYLRGSTTATAPHWVHLARVGDVFTSSVSSDGVIWTVVQTWTVPMAAEVYIGLSVTSHNDGVLTTAVMGNVSVTSSDLGLTYNAAGFDSESHLPRDNNIIRDQGTNVGYIRNNTWVRYDAFKFGSGANSIEISASSESLGGTVEVRIGSSTGTLLGSVQVSNTGAWATFLPFTATFSNSVSGVEDLYLVFTGASGFLMNIESFRID